MAGTAVSGRLSGRLGWRTATLVEIQQETAQANTLVFDIPGWPGHLAGQHVDVRLTAEDGYTAQRSYSLSAPADGDRVAMTVALVEDGEVSPYLLRGLAIGESVELRGPVGGWFVWRPTDPDPVLLVAGGSGVAPLMAMVRARRRAGSRVPFRLIYSVRRPDDAFYARELRVPPSADGGLDTGWIYTRQLLAGAPGVPHRISVTDLVAHGWPPELTPTCYVCGPTGFVETVASALVDLGHDPDRIRTERFGPSGPNGG